MNRELPMGREIPNRSLCTEIAEFLFFNLNHRFDSTSASFVSPTRNFRIMEINEMKIWNFSQTKVSEKITNSLLFFYGKSKIGSGCGELLKKKRKYIISTFPREETRTYFC